MSQENSGSPQPNEETGPDTALESYNGQADPLKEHHDLKKCAIHLHRLKLEDLEFQESIYKLLQYHSKERRIESKHFCHKLAFLLKYTPNLNSKS